VNRHPPAPGKPDRNRRFADAVLEYGVAHTEEPIAKRLRTQPPFDVDLIDEQPLVHRADGVVAGNRDQAAGGDERVARDGFARTIIAVDLVHSAHTDADEWRITTAVAIVPARPHRGDSHSGRLQSPQRTAQAIDHARGRQAVLVEQQNVITAPFAGAPDAEVLRGGEPEVVAVANHVAALRCEAGQIGAGVRGGRVVDQHQALDLRRDGVEQRLQGIRPGEIRHNDGADALRPAWFHRDRAAARGDLFLRNHGAARLARSRGVDCRYLTERMKAFETTRVSIAMATYNGERYIEAQVRSILKQLGGDDEVVIVDDASTDRTRERIAAFADPRIRLHVNDRNEGVMRSFGRALRMTSGSIIFLADQDDVWLPGKRAALAEALHDAAVAVSDAQVIDGEGAIIAPSFMALRGGFRAGLAATLIRNRYLGCAMAFRRELLEVALPIPAGVPMHDMWLGAVSGLVGRTVYIDRPLMQYRRHEANVSPWRHADPVRMLLWRWQLARNVVARSMAVRCRVGGR
jgi:hypothetical protein